MIVEQKGPDKHGPLESVDFKITGRNGQTIHLTITDAPGMILVSFASLDEQKKYASVDFHFHHDEVFQIDMEEV